MFSGWKKTEKGCSKIDAKKMMRHLEQNKPNLCDRRAGFGAGGEVRRGQAPPGPAISGSDSASQFNTPCTRRGAADVLVQKRGCGATVSIDSVIFAVLVRFGKLLFF